MVLAAPPGREGFISFLGRDELTAFVVSGSITLPELPSFLVALPLYPSAFIMSNAFPKIGRVYIASAGDVFGPIVRGWTMIVRDHTWADSKLSGRLPNGLPNGHWSVETSKPARD